MDDRAEAAAFVDLLDRPAEDAREALARPPEHQAPVGVHRALVHEAGRHRDDGAVARLALREAALGALAPVDVEQDPDDALGAATGVALDRPRALVHPDP